MPNQLSKFEKARRLDEGLAKLKEAYRLLKEIGNRLEAKHGKRKAA